jgi:putative endonuclease
MSSFRGVGREAEDRAAAYLLDKGYTLVTRRYKARHGEVDLVVLDGDVLVFIEVKRRSKPGYVPEESVTEKKAQRLASAAREYVHAAGENGRTVRFDLVCIDLDGIRHHIDAFRPSAPPRLVKEIDEADEYELDI